MGGITILNTMTSKRFSLHQNTPSLTFSTHPCKLKNIFLILRLFSHNHMFLYINEYFFPNYYSFSTLHSLTQNFPKWLPLLSQLYHSNSYTLVVIQFSPPNPILTQIISNPLDLFSLYGSTTTTPSLPFLPLQITSLFPSQFHFTLHLSQFLHHFSFTNIVNLSSSFTPQHFPPLLSLSSQKFKKSLKYSLRLLFTSSLLLTSSLFFSFMN